MVMPQCSDGVTDMLRHIPWNLTAYGEDCMKIYGVPIQPNLIEVLYGGKNISAHSNIIFRWVPQMLQGMLIDKELLQHTAMDCLTPGTVVVCFKMFQTP
jgi:hypothetical protein